VDCGIIPVRVADVIAALGHPPRAVGTFSTYTFSPAFPPGISVLNPAALPPGCPDAHLLAGVEVAGVDALANRATVIATTVSPARTGTTLLHISVVRISLRRDMWGGPHPR
jgi:hypothetical protein